MSLRILLLDDEEDIVHLLSDALTFEGGFEVTGFTKTAEALQAVKENPFDVIVSDVRMPVIDGIEFLQSLRSASDNTPVILLTGFADVTEAEAKEAGAFCMIYKPWKLNQLVAEINRASKSGGTSHKIA